MTFPARIAAPDVKTLFGLFGATDDIPEYESIAGDQVPPPYHGLLVHEHHMTVTVEAHHGDAVNVRILERRQSDDWYARKILLTLQGTGRVVQFGVFRIHFRFCSAEVKNEILAGQQPLGRILISHNVLRRIEPTAFLRVIPNQVMMDWFGLDQPKPTYGRLAYIHCDGQPAIELLEIVVPE